MGSSGLSLPRNPTYSISCSHRSTPVIGKKSCFKLYPVLKKMFCSALTLHGFASSSPFNLFNRVTITNLLLNSEQTLNKELDEKLCSRYIRDSFAVSPEKSGGKTREVHFENTGFQLLVTLLNSLVTWPPPAPPVFAQTVHRRFYGANIFHGQVFAEIFADFRTELAQLCGKYEAIWQVGELLTGFFTLLFPVSLGQDKYPNRCRSGE